jgi:hypothetical protein
MSNDASLERRALLAVLAAAAQEAEELLALREEFDEEARDEANRRLRLFMNAAWQAAR